MRILFIAPQPFFRVRGTPLAVRKLLETYSALGHHITLMTYPFGQDVPIPNVTIQRGFRCPGIRSVKIGPSWGKLVLDVFLFPLCLWEIMRGKYDVIHGVEEGALMAMPLAWLAKVPLVYDMDSNMPDQLRTSGFLKNRLLLRLVGFLERFMIRRARIVITVCPDLSEHVREVSQDAIVFQIEDAPLICPVEETSIRKELSLMDRILAVYTGNFEAYQGLDLLLEGLPTVLVREPNLSVVLVGGIGDRLAWAKRKCQELSLDPARVMLLSSRPPEDVEPFLREADILLSPRSKGVNTPFKIYTYLAHGKPILATRLPTHTQVLSDEVALLADPSVKGLAEGLLRLAGDAQLRERLGSAGKALVEERYGQDVYEKKVDALLAALEDSKV